MEVHSEHLAGAIAIARRPRPWWRVGPGTRQPLSDPGRGPGLDDRLERVLVRLAYLVRHEAWIGREVRRADQRGEALPLRVARHGDRTPLVLATRRRQPASLSATTGNTLNSLKGHC